MQRSSPLSRSIEMFVAMAGAMSGAVDTAAAQVKIAAIGEFQSQGKGEGRTNRRPRGAGMASVRAAAKARNVKRHRKAR